ncbi:MAG: putative Ig domain-containing protein [Nanoarchaeota archaeon]
MVHKRYVKRGKKVYGPYLYNSKRVGNKVVNEYLGIDKSGEWKKAGLIVSFFVVLLLGIVYAEYGVMSGTTGGTNSNLTIWDGASAGAENPPYWYSNCTSGPGSTTCLAGKTITHFTVKFYANYSNSTVGPIIGNCTIHFNYTGIYTEVINMTYSPSTLLYEYNHTFDRRGNFTFEVNCTNSTYETLNATDSFEIKNSAPYNIIDQIGNTAPAQSCTEDTVCTYNVSTNFTDDDINDQPLSSFSIYNSSSSEFANCDSIASSTGMLTIACTNSNQAGSHYSNIIVTDGAGSTSASFKIPYTIYPVNDNPIITASSLVKTCTEGTLCSFNISVWDEESGAITNGIGAIENFTFTDNSSMFEINSTTGNISFIPTNAQVGTHRIEINVTDPDNGRNTSVLVLTINNYNDPPTLFYACDNIDEIPLTEDVVFSCMLNASDPDPDGTDSHTYTANYSWFTINCNNVPISGGNTSCNVTFTPTDIAVYSHWINITVNDSGNLKSSRLLNFSVENVPDYPYWKNITNMTAWANVSYWKQVTADDNDTLTQFGDWVNYSANYSWFNINAATGVILFNNTELNEKVGTHWINITANDSTGLGNSIIINFTVYANSYPTLIINQEYNLTEGYAFSLNISANVTEPEGDYVNYTDNTTLFTINPATGVIEFTPTDSDVGAHWVEINITDSHGTTNTSIFNFTVYNEEDAPVLETIYNMTNLTEGIAFTFYINFTDADLNITGGNETIHVQSNATGPTALFPLDLYVTRANATGGRVIFPVTFTPSSTSNGTYWINITLNDSAGLGDSQIVWLNVTEGNVAPMFMAEDPAFCAVRTAEEDTLFASCTLIACDNDTGTTLSFNANYSWFNMSHSAITATQISENVYCANVTVNFTPDYTEVGNWSILLNVTDYLGAFDTYTISFNISSVNDAPNLTYISDLFAVYDVIYTYDINATDEEGDTLAFYHNASYSWLSIDSSTGIITINAVSLDAGTYRINFTVNDTSGATDSQVVNITIRANTAPYCTVIANTYRTLTRSDNTGVNSYDPRTEYVNFSMRESEITGNFSATCIDDESDTITYEWYWNTTLNQTGSTAGTSNKFGYRTTYLDAGNYTMKLVVKDTGQNNTYYINVSIANINAPPGLITNIPNISRLNNGNGWYNDVQNSRNMTAYFQDTDNDNLTYTWYRYAFNESFTDNNATRANMTWTFDGSWYLFNDSEIGLTIRQSDTSDLRYAVYNNLPMSNITEFKAKIKLLGSGSAGLCFSSSGDCSTKAQRFFLNSTDNKTYFDYISGGVVQNANSSYSISIAQNTSYWLKISLTNNITSAYVSSDNVIWNLTYQYAMVPMNSTEGNVSLFTANTEAVFDDIVMKDPDLRNMTLKDEGGNNVSFTPATGWHGEISLVITASDGINSTDSNKFTLHVDEVTVPPPTIVTQTTTSTSTTMQTRSADMTILVPSMISLTPLSKTIVPIILKNSGQIDLSTITLSATTNQSELRLKLNETSWTALKIGDSVYVNLDVDIGLLAPDRYTIRIDAESQVPALKRFAEIVVDVREKDAVLKAQLKEMIQFTRDLFLQNPECLELTELINEAEANFRNYQYEEGLEMIHRANQGCKEFIAAKKGETDVRLSETAKNFIEQHWKTIILEGIGLILAVLLLVYYFQRRSALKL